MDADGDGDISAEECARLLRLTGQNENATGQDASMDPGDCPFFPAACGDDVECAQPCHR